MNGGKSETWFYYASTIMRRYNMDYTMKIDTDSMIYLDRYFKFAHHSLPPKPYNKRIIAGAPVDKAWWKLSSDKVEKQEPYFKSQYSSLHLYAAGQMYILSSDLAKGVAHVADTEDPHYKAGHEDHDVSTMAFLALKEEVDKPIKFIMLPYSDPFWNHPLKLKYGIVTLKLLDI